MNTCISCGKEGTYSFHALTIRTLPVRDLSGEKKVQAIGDFQDFCVCRSCAEAMLSRKKDVRHNMSKKFLGFGLTTAAGILWTAAAALFLNAEWIYLSVGLAAIACGLIGLVSAWKEGKGEQEKIGNMGQEEALQYAAWQTVLEKAPSKNQDENLTYIPVTEETKRRKNGDLMILYDLLPAIAAKAWEMIQEE